MHIGKDELLAGVPAKRLRDTLIKIGQDSWSRKKLREELKLAPSETAGILARLKAEGYLAASDRLRGWYRTGPASQRLVNVLFIKRITRAKADTPVAGLIERARQINNDDRFVLSVTELRAFGSYIESDKNDLGDVDIGFAVEVKPKFDADDVTGLSKHTERDFPRIPPRNFLEFLFLPRKVVLRTLKNRSPYISLHSIEDLAKIGVTGATIFRGQAGAPLWLECVARRSIAVHTTAEPTFRLVAPAKRVSTPCADLGWAGRVRQLRGLARPHRG
jgi:hypothetical protein